MENNDKHIKEILNYLGNKMPDKDRYAFERRMEADPFLMDAVDGYQNMPIDEVENILLQLHAKIGNKHKARIVPMWMRVAAGILLPLGVGILLLIDQNNEKANLVSDKIEIVKEKEPLFRSEVNAESEEDIVELEEMDIDSDIQDDVEKLVPQHKKIFTRQLRIPKQVTSKVVVEDKRYKQDVNKSLRYEDTAVRVERALVGRIEGVKVSDVTSRINDRAVEVKMRGMASLRDSFSMAFRGRVVDEQGIPLPGVIVSKSVAVGGYSQSGNKQGVITDFDGNFEIKAPQAGAVLQLSFIGFKDQIAVVNHDSIGNLVMESQQLALDEMVVVGYGSQKKEKLAKDTSRKSRVSDHMLISDAGLIPEPVGGIKKLVRKIEREFKYPGISKKDDKVVEVKVIVSKIGKVLKIETASDIEASFILLLEERLKTTKWLAPQINGMPVESSRNITFEFAGAGK